MSYLFCHPTLLRQALVEWNPCTAGAMCTPVRPLELVRRVEANVRTTSFASDAMWSDVCSVWILFEKLSTGVFFLAFRSDLGVAGTT
jgi:hypothetical protein